MSLLTRNSASRWTNAVSPAPPGRSSRPTGTGRARSRRDCRCQDGGDRLDNVGRLGRQRIGGEGRPYGELAQLAGRAEAQAHGRGDGLRSGRRAQLVVRGQDLSALLGGERRAAQAPGDGLGVRVRAWPATSGNGAGCPTRSAA
ncbi:hypothetical protein [Streptomyces yangpuensis]|uniref:hypothetical protein n=1 Tax=Streptomyces yangpuensis TaxID=1648182 RepID=UPI0037220F6F